MSLVNYVPSFLLPSLRASRFSSSDCDLFRQINSTGQTLRDLPPAALKDRAEVLRGGVLEGRWIASDDHVVQEGFALVNESVRRSLGLHYFDVQFLAAHALVRGHVAEMATGEGKTLVQALAAFVLALPGQGVHVMTSNAYLAERDFSQLAPVLEPLGLSVGLLHAQAGSSQNARAYQADITYGAGYQFGFDYLRDQVTQQRQPHGLDDAVRQGMRAEPDEEIARLQRGHAVAIVDEADSVMIDEATTPLLLSSTPPPSDEGGAAYAHAATVAIELHTATDYVADPRQRSVRLTQHGLETILAESMLPVGMKLERPWPVYIEQALVARHFLCRDVDYIVDRDQIVLVDQATGRIFADRLLREGLHQAVEAKEQVSITAVRPTQARISRQQFFRLYDTLCGMTGTARDAEREFGEIYGRRIVLIPTRKPCRRIVLPTRYFASQEAKRRAVVEEIRQRHATGQPVLVGTRTIEESTQAAKMLGAAGVPFELLNGTQDTAEAEVIAGAGHPGAVTIATNIAGRGTDIQLGNGVEHLGGLHVIATEAHASSRVDRQLFGRAARQGDPGSCQMFVCSEDELIRVFGARMARTMQRLADADGEVHEDLSHQLARLQSRVERLNFEKRRLLLRRDAWIADVLARLTGHPPP